MSISKKTFLEKIAQAMYIVSVFSNSVCYFPMKKVLMIGLIALKISTLNAFGQVLMPKSDSFNPVNIGSNIDEEDESKNLLSNKSILSTNSNESHQIVRSILNEINQYKPPEDYKLPSLQSELGAEHFNKAFDEIVGMLEGDQPLSLKRAVFLTENAYFGNKMELEKYLRHIKEMAMILSLKMQQEGLEMDDNQAINYIVHQFMGDTLIINVPNSEQTVTTFPKRYDFDDPFGYEDGGKLFVSKLLAMNTGQCKSLPLLYLILVYELGGHAYLSLSPSHSFIKYQTEKGVMVNLELTNNRFTSDSWITGSGYVKSEAIRNGIYLDTLSKRKIVAQCLVDLGQYYSWRFGGYDEFVLKCANKALEYHPNNILAFQVKSDYYTLLFQEVAKKLMLENMEQLKTNPKANALFEQMKNMYGLIDNLGYEDMPEKAYLDWLQTLEEKQQQQLHNKQNVQLSKSMH